MQWPPPDLTLPQLHTVVAAATWSMRAYSATGDARVHRFECASCDAHCIVFSTDIPTPDTLVVSVRGTASAKDMLCDLEVGQTCLTDCVQGVQVHTGFHRQSQALASLADAVIQEHMRSSASASVIFTGHSLGAGVASVMAAVYSLSFPGRVAFAGFGTPRSGNAALVQLIHSNTTMAVCVKNRRDPVCSCIPRTRFPVDYEHAGRVLCIGNDPFPDIPDPLFLRDHDISAYVRHLDGIPLVPSETTHHGETFVAQHIARRIGRPMMAVRFRDVGNVPASSATQLPDVADNVPEEVVRQVHDATLPCVVNHTADIVSDVPAPIAGEHWAFRWTHMFGASVCLWPFDHDHTQIRLSDEAHA